MNIEGRVALVTGANRGIGMEIALALAKAGCAVGVHYHSAEDMANNVVAAIEKSGGCAVAVRGDIRNREEAEAIAVTVKSRLGPIDILINNARQLGAKKKFLELSWSDYEPQIEVIFKGAFNCCQAVLPTMIERGRGGRIINMLSTITEEPSWRWHTYGAAKGALQQLTRHLAAEMAEHNITVNMVSPGFTRTADRQTPHGDDYLRDVLAHIPMGRFVRPDEVAQAVVFLAGDHSGFITGANLPLSGGKIMN